MAIQGSMGVVHNIHERSPFNKGGRAYGKQYNFRGKVQENSSPCPMCLGTLAYVVHSYNTVISFQCLDPACGHLALNKLAYSVSTSNHQKIVSYAYKDYVDPTLASV